ncbi:hypothetical protein C7U60_09760 [Mesorhizobium plurifarium]|nr:hypothetical protein C7U60_09760 [Mesorhizobium plurifarium]
MPDHEEIGVPCPECGHETSKPVAWVKANDELPCRRCGTPIALENEKHLLTIEQVAQSMTKLRRPLEKFRRNARGARWRR